MKPERSRHCISEQTCKKIRMVFSICHWGIPGKAQVSDELEPGELPD